MVLVDTSVWIDHFRRRNSGLTALLEEGAVLCHPFVVGELACGNLQNRKEVLDLLKALPPASLARQDEVLHLLQERRLYGQSLGWIDAHLLASAKLMGCPVWTLDRPLARAAGEINQAL
jgi:hypothetical protein